MTVFAQTAGDCSVELTADGAGVPINRYLGNATVIIVPATIEGMPVREIGAKAFYGMGITKNFTVWNSLITSVTLHQGWK
jgi:hypothetical protein